MLWQLSALSTARRLRHEHRHDVVWHLTLANLWMGSMAPLAGGRFVLGPVGGGAGPPIGLLPVLGIRGLCFELARVVMTRVGRYLNPIARLAWCRAGVVLVQNPETRDWLPKRHQHKTVVFPNALIASTGAPAAVRPNHVLAHPTMLFAGELLPMKGVYLAILALELLPEWRLVICGSGSDERRLRRLAVRRHLTARIEFRGWVDREDLRRVMREEADVLVFPSLRDQAGFAVAEASEVGLPTVCLNAGGPRLVGGIPVAASTPRATAQRLASAIRRVRNVRANPLPDREQQLRRLRDILDAYNLLRAPRLRSDAEEGSQDRRFPSP